METYRNSNYTWDQVKHSLTLTRVPDHCEVCQRKVFGDTGEQLWFSHQTDEYLCEDCALDTEL